MSCVQVLQHISIPLNKNFRILLTMAQLLVSITLDALQEIRHEISLLLNCLVFYSIKLLLLFLILSELLEFFKFVS